MIDSRSRDTTTSPSLGNLIGEWFKAGYDRFLDYCRENWISIALKVLGIVLIIIFWGILVHLARTNEIEFLLEHRIHQLPTPEETWEALIEDWTPENIGPLYRPSLPEHILASIERVIIGFLIACLVGIPSGLIMGRRKTAEDIGGSMVEVIRPIPPLAWIGVGFIIFTTETPIFIVFLGCVFPIILSTIQGVKSVDVRLIEAAQTLGAGRFARLRKVIIPASMPAIVTGMRIGLGIGWMCIVSAEMIGLKEGVGLGYFVLSMYQDYGDYASMVGGMILIGIIGLIMNIIIEGFERHFLRQRE